MQAVILVGGEGTRLRPLTYSIPKPMVPIVNRPFIVHMLDHLQAHGVTETLFLIGYKAEVFLEYFPEKTYRGMKLEFIREEQPLGTAGAVKNVEDRLEESFWVLNGDILSDINLGQVHQLFESKSPMGVLTLTKVDDPTLYGVVETSQDGRVERFTEKPAWEEVRSHYINAGMYFLKKAALELIPPQINYSFEKGLFPQLLAQGYPLYGFQSSGYWLDIGSPYKYLKSNLDALEKKLQVNFPYKEIAPGVWLGEGAKISMKGPVNPPLVMGKNSVIGAGASVTGPVVMGDNCIVGPEARVENLVLWDGAKIGEKAQVKNCILAQDSEICSGVELSNRVLAKGLKVGSGELLEEGEQQLISAGNLTLLNESS